MSQSNDSSIQLIPDYEYTKIAKIISDIELSEDEFIDSEGLIQSRPGGERERERERERKRKSEGKSDTFR